LKSTKLLTSCTNSTLQQHAATARCNGTLQQRVATLTAHHRKAHFDFFYSKAFAKHLFMSSVAPSSVSFLWINLGNR
jgi:hypothetical protein